MRKTLRVYSFICLAVFSLTSCKTTQPEMTSKMSLFELKSVPKGFKLPIAKTLVINLDNHEKSKVRLLKMQKQFKDQNISFQLDRFPAIYGKNYPQVLAKRGNQVIDAKRGWSYEYDPEYHPRVLSQPEIGIYLSHYEIIKSVQNSPSNVMVFEDDAMFVEDFEQRLKSLMSHAPEDWDIIYLNCFQKYNWGCNAENSNLYKNARFLELTHCMPGMSSYIITPEAAKKITPHLMPIKMPIDENFKYKIFAQTYGPFKAYCAFPEIVKVPDLGEDSIIDSMGRPKI